MRHVSTLPAPAPALFLTPTEIVTEYPELRPKPLAARRPSPQQGIALEMLGHAIEYLVDSNFYHHRSEDPSLQEAIAILKKSSRAVFAAAPEAVPPRARAMQWLRSRLPRQQSVSTHLPSAPARLILVKR